jgi:hypothetical protein
VLHREAADSSRVAALKKPGARRNDIAWSGRASLATRAGARQILGRVRANFACGGGVYMPGAVSP